MTGFARPGQNVSRVAFLLFLFIAEQSFQQATEPVFEMADELRGCGEIAAQSAN